MRLVHKQLDAQGRALGLFDLRDGLREYTSNRNDGNIRSYYINMSKRFFFNGRDICYQEKIFFIIIFMHNQSVFNYLRSHNVKEGLLLSKRGILLGRVIYTVLD